MTRLQARFVQWLVLKGCSLRATSGNFHGRYNDDFTNKGVPHSYDHNSVNQVDGMWLVEEAIRVLNGEGINPHMSLFEADTDGIGYEEWRKRTKKIL